MAKGLDERQAKFCGLCAEGIAPEDAARLAGYRKKGVEKTLLASEKIRVGIEAGRQRADGSAAGRRRGIGRERGNPRIFDRTDAGQKSG